MTSEKPNLHLSKNLSISKTKQDIDKLKTPSRLVWKVCSLAFKIGSTIFSLHAVAHFKLVGLKFVRYCIALQNFKKFGKN